MEYKRKDFDFGKHGGFFAFGQKQFDEKKQEGVKYLHIMGGLYLPSNKAKEIMKLADEHYANESKRRKEIEGIENIVWYEYNNYECDYQGDIEDIMFLCDEYDITREEIKKIIKERKEKIVC